jgi:large subunit ribosomal protein L21
MLAIVDLNGKQYQVEEGRYVTVDRLSLDEESTLDLSNILMVVDGEESLVGAPFVEGALVKAKVLRHTRGSKILVYKMRCKKGYRRKNGHRQDYTQLQIVSVDFPGKKEKQAKSEEKQEVKQPKAKKAASKAKAEEASA